MAARAHITLPEELLDEIDNLVGPRGRSRYICDALEQQVRRDRQLAALKALMDAPWEEAAEPPDWAGQDSVEWVRKQRDFKSERELRIEREHPPGGRP